MTTYPHLRALRDHMARYPFSGVLTHSGRVEYHAAIEELDALLALADAPPGQKGDPIVFAKETTTGSAPRELRELPAPDGTRCRWNPNESGYPAQVYRTWEDNEAGAPYGDWVTAHASFVVDHAKIFDALRAQPYVERHSEVVEAIYFWYYSGRKNRVDRENIAPFAKSLASLVLASTPVGALVAALEAKGARVETVNILDMRSNVTRDESRRETRVILPPEAGR